MADTASTSTNNLITLVSKDGHEFKITKPAMARCVTIRDLIDNLNFDYAETPEPIPILEVKSDTLRKVVEYCEHQVNEPIYEKDEDVDTTVIPDYVKGFLNLDRKDLYDVIRAANYLNIKCLLQYACQTVANIIKGKSQREIRRLYNITRPHTRTILAQFVLSTLFYRMAENIEKERIVKLRSSDGEEFTLPRDAIRQSTTINDLLQNLGLDDSEVPTEAIPLPNVTSETLAKIIEYCEHHINDPILTDEQQETNKTIGDWDAQFLDIDQTKLYHLVLGANYLHISNLLHVACQYIANMIKGKSTADIRRIYNIQNDFTPEEEAEIKKETAWCEI